jgi:hypothetical protein
VSAQPEGAAPDQDIQRPSGHQFDQPVDDVVLGPAVVDGDDVGVIERRDGGEPPRPREDDRPRGRSVPAAGTYNFNVCIPAELPGADLIDEGIRDLDLGIVSAAALLVSIGAPRLTALGIAVPHALPDAEHRLYAWLADREGPAAHSRYNALVRRLVSFERALACAR